VRFSFRGNNPGSRAMHAAFLLSCDSSRNGHGNSKSYYLLRNRMMIFQKICLDSSRRMSLFDRKEDATERLLGFAGNVKSSAERSCGE